MPDHADDTRLDALLYDALARPGGMTDADPAVFDDAELAALRAGALSADAVVDLEGRLAESPEGRGVLLGLADPPNDFHLLQAEKAARAALGGRPSRRATPWLALAAAGVLGLGAWWLAAGGAGGPTVGAADYAAGALQGGAAVVRSEAPAGTPVYYPSSTLVLKLRPSAARTPPRVHLLLSSGDGPLLSRPGWTASATPEGALIIEAEAGAFFPEAGDWTVHVVLGPEGTPTRAEAAQPGVWWQRYPARFAPEPGGSN